MSIRYDAFFLIICIVLALISFGSIFYDPLILFSLITIMCAMFLMFTKKMSKRNLLLVCAFSILPILFWVSCTIYFNSKSSKLDIAKISYAKKNFKEIYSIYKNNRNEFQSFIADLKKKDKKTILKDAFLLTFSYSSNSNILIEHEKYPLAIYFFYNIYKQNSIYVILFNDGNTNVIIQKE